jgi:lipid-binding SYLF domain-containing protein
MKENWASIAAAGLLLAFASTALPGCAALSVEEREAKRAELDAMADTTIETLLATKPQSAEVLERSLGYVVLDMKVTKIPVVGAGSGLGVVVDRRTDTRSYLKISRFEIGGGLGAQKFKVIIVFDDGKLLDRAAAGAWHYDAGAELAAGTASSEGSVQAAPKGFQAYRLVEGGALATVTVRVARAKPYLD